MSLYLLLILTAGVIIGRYWVVRPDKIEYESVRGMREVMLYSVNPAFEQQYDPDVKWNFNEHIDLARFRNYSGCSVQSTADSALDLTTINGTEHDIMGNHSLTHTLTQITNTVLSNPFLMDEVSMAMGKSTCQCLDEFAKLKHDAKISESFYDRAVARFCSRYAARVFGVKYEGQLDAMVLTNIGCVLLLLFVWSIVFGGRLYASKRPTDKTGRHSTSKEEVLAFVVFGVLSFAFIVHATGV